MRSVRPVRPAAGYIGGKRNLATRLVAMIEAIEHRLYAEPFVGMGGVFLRRRLIPPAEAINDLSRDVANLFRILQRHYPQFMDVLRFQLSARADFERLMRTDPATLTDLERAARFIVLQKLAYGGKVTGRNFGVDPRGSAGFNLARLAPLLDELHQRLAGVTIECLPWSDFLTRYDRPETLFYLDPPYWGSEGDYGEGLFSRDDFARLPEQLAGLKGRFILSVNDRPELRRLFKGFRLQAVRTHYHIASGATPARELIVSSRR